MCISVCVYVYMCICVFVYVTAAAIGVHNVQLVFDLALLCRWRLESCIPATVAVPLSHALTGKLLHTQTGSTHTHTPCIPPRMHAIYKCIYAHIYALLHI